MKDEYNIQQVEGEPSDEMWGVIGGGINGFNQKHGGDENYKRICFILYTPENKVAGGLIGATYWGWLYIDLLFIKDELRGHGYGRQLLTLTEQEARKRGAANAFLDTFSFQAQGFYEKQGYRIFGELKDFPPGHSRYYMTKEF